MDNEYHQIMPKMSGYLEKKGRKKMMSCYKKYWFVLEGRLLLYYKSKDEYDAISPCKGSINLGPTSSVKPCTSNVGVFQIESKTTTITLRAETREEQHKWMQGLMSALNQRSDYKKLNHFRHSVGELSPTLKPFALERQNTLPKRLNSCSSDVNMTIIQKLQRLGARTYGIGPKLQRSKTTLERQKQISFSDESIPSTTNFKSDLRFRNNESVITENEEYGKMDLLMRRANSIESVDASSEGIYERIPSSDSVFMRRGNINLLSEKLKYADDSERSKSTEEDIYSEPKETLDVENTNNRASAVTTENDMYWTRCDIQKNNNDGTEYCYEAIDYNKNNIAPKLRKSSNRDENVYAEADMKENRNTGNSVEYADIAQVDYVDIGPSEYADIEQYAAALEAARNSSLSSQGSNEDKDKKIFGFGKKYKMVRAKSEEKKTKVKKSESFLQRVWHKKSKNKKNKKEISLSTSNIAKLEMTDDDTVKTLSELQDILKKQAATAKQLHEPRNVRQSLAEEEESEMISEKNGVVSGKVGENESSSPKNQQSTRPSLPPRNQKKSSASLYNIPQPQPPSVPPKMKKKSQSAPLDNILNELNKIKIMEKKSSSDNENENDSQNKEGKVKELIKRFSIGKEEGVELRQKTNWKLKSDPTGDSNDLDKLLDELAKVTTAPIMSPGVTTSLINPEISDKEIMKMVPIRRRRLSDPDYDVPRPHRSLTNLPKKDDNAMEATRFFGPILKPSDYDNHATNRPPSPPEDYYSNLPSITPDSLEVECRKLELSHDELRTISFESHDYLSFKKSSHHNLDFLVEKDVYTDPRFLYKSGNDFSLYPGGPTFHLDDPETRFIDSLEP